MIEITDTLILSDDAFEEHFVRAPGAGGQNVNKVSSAVQLRFDARRCKALPTSVYLRLKALAGRRMNNAGVIVLSASRFRTQASNRKEARERMVEMIKKATEVPKYRRATKPKYASKLKRLDSKKRKSNVKKTRGKVNIHD